MNSIKVREAPAQGVNTHLSKVPKFTRKSVKARIYCDVVLPLFLDALSSPDGDGALTNKESPPITGGIRTAVVIVCAVTDFA